jgi:hypothetical protein
MVKVTLTTGIINVSAIHLHALLGVGNLTKMVRDCRRFQKHCLSVTYSSVANPVCSVVVH